LVKKVSVIVPVYNEEKTILAVLGKVKEQNVRGIDFEIIVVDDGSTDRTAKLLEANPGLYTRLIRQQRNGGKGAAVKAGLSAATGDYILFQDADLEYNPADYVKILRPVIEFDADLVLGSRFVAPEYTRVFYFWNKVGNHFITLLFNILNNTTFTDIYSCYLLYRRDLLEPSELATTGWEQHAEILSKVARRAARLYEVPINYFGRTYAEGKKIRARHVLSVIWAIVRFRLLR
jgi:glycosyltransferase involved in cell wall biosynthesis